MPLSTNILGYYLDLAYWLKRYYKPTPAASDSYVFLYFICQGDKG